MTSDEVEKITKIMLTADHFCNQCSRDLIELFQKAFPEVRGVIDGIWQKREIYEEMFRKLEANWWDNPDSNQPNIWDCCL